MSHRVTTQTEIKDKRLAMEALKKAGMTFVENGDSLRITSGRLSNATIDLRTGSISGDTDYGHSATVLREVIQAYGEAKYRQECQRQGIQVESRSVDQKGNVVLLCHMA